MEISNVTESPFIRAAIWSERRMQSSKWRIILICDWDRCAQRLPAAGYGRWADGVALSEVDLRFAHQVASARKRRSQRRQRWWCAHDCGCASRFLLPAFQHSKQAPVLPRFMLLAMTTGELPHSHWQSHCTRPLAPFSARRITVSLPKRRPVKSWKLGIAGLLANHRCRLRLCHKGDCPAPQLNMPNLRNLALRCWCWIVMRPRSKSWIGRAAGSCCCWNSRLPCMTIAWLAEPLDQSLIALAARHLVVVRIWRLRKSLSDHGIYGYARVSTDGQSLASQDAQLRTCCGTRACGSWFALLMWYSNSRPLRGSCLVTCRPDSHIATDWRRTTARSVMVAQGCVRPDFGYSSLIGRCSRSAHTAWELLSTFILYPLAER